MKRDAENPSRWSTSSFGGTPAPSATELIQLKEQLDECNGSRGRWFALRSAVESTSAFVGNRIVTSLMFLLLLATAIVELVSTWWSL